MNPDIPVVVPQGDTDNVHYKNRDLYPSGDPCKRAEQKASAISLSENTLVICASPLLLHGIDVLLEHLPGDCHILCVEADPHLAAIPPLSEKRHILTDSRVSLLTTGDLYQVLKAVHALGLGRFRRCLLVTLNRGYTLHSDFYRSIQAAVQSEIEGFWKNRMTLIHMAPLWIKNLFTNLSVFHQSMDLRIAKTERCIFVAGAGESIEEILPVLRRLRDSLYILSVDTALPVLLASDITPDGVVTLESQVFNLNDFIGASALHIPIFCDLLAYPSTYYATRGEVYFFVSRFAPNRLLDRMDTACICPPVVPPLGSVGVTAVHLALHMTNKRVFYAGLDFSFVQGKTHSRGTPTHIKSLSSSTRLVSYDTYKICLDFPGYLRKDKAGRTVKTTLILDSYREVLSKTISQSERVFDAGSLGLSAEGVRPTDINSLQCSDESDGLGMRMDVRHTERPEEPFLKTKNFLEQESELLTEVSKKGRILLASQSGTDLDAFIAAVDTCDYLLLHFPDPEGIESCDPPFIARVCAAAELYNRYIGRALQRLSRIS